MTFTIKAKKDFDGEIRTVEIERNSSASVGPAIAQLSALGCYDFAVDVKMSPTETKNAKRSATQLAASRSKVYG